LRKNHSGMETIWQPNYQLRGSVELRKNHSGMETRFLRKNRPVPTGVA